MFLGRVLRALCGFRSVELVFFFVFCQSKLFLTLRKPHVRIWQLLLLSFKLVFFLGLILRLTLTALTLHQFQAPTPTTASTNFDTFSIVPSAFHGVGMFIWVSVDWRLVRVCLLIHCFFEAQAFDCRWETQTNQTKTLWWIEPRIPLSPPAFGFGFALSFSI